MLAGWVVLGDGAHFHWMEGPSESQFRPVGWFWGIERVFVGWKVHLSHSVGWLDGFGGWSVFSSDGRSI